MLNTDGKLIQLTSKTIEIEHSLFNSKFKELESSFVIFWFIIKSLNFAR